MKKKAILSILIVSAALLVALPVVAEVEVRTLSQTFSVEGADQIDLDLSVGSVRVEGSDDPFVSVDVRLECNRQDLEKCRRRAGRLFVSPRVTGQRLDIRLRGTPRAHLQGIKAHMMVRMPRYMGLEIDMRTADVVVTDLLGHLEVDGVEGQLDITYPQNAVRSVDAKVGAGKVDLWVDGASVEGAGFPRSVKWQGSGQAEIEIDLAAGDVDVKLN